MGSYARESARQPIAASTALSLKSISRCRRQRRRSFDLNRFNMVALP
jgi:hypothetical protein